MWVAALMGSANSGVIISVRGRWRLTLLARKLAICCVGKGMASGCGSGKRLLHRGSGASSRMQYLREPGDRKRGP